METSILSQQINLQMTEASCDCKGKCLNISQSAPLGDRTAANYLLGPIRSGGKSWQKHCVSRSKQICLDAWRPVATRLQSLRLDFPLVIYCWPSANWEWALVRSDERNKVWLKAACLFTHQYNPKLKIYLIYFSKAPDVPQRNPRHSNLEGKKAQSLCF